MGYTEHDAIFVNVLFSLRRSRDRVVFFTFVCEWQGQRSLRSCIGA